MNEVDFGIRIVFFPRNIFLIKTKIMKKTIQYLGIMLLAVAVFASCSKDTSPADTDVFVGTYNGRISYNASGDANDVAATNGTVRVAKIGNNYNFIFSNGIPDITGVQFSKDDNTLISVGSDESNYIRVTANSLKILFLKDGNLWTADCTR